MLDQKEENKIKEAVEEFFEKMTIEVSNIEISSSSEKKYSVEENKDIVDLNIKLNEPQILIGQGGQTLFEIQRLLRTILNKKLQKVFYLNLDINDYKKLKFEYLKDLAKDLADQVSLTKREKVFTGFDWGGALALGVSLSALVLVLDQQEVHRRED